MKNIIILAIAMLLCVVLAVSVQATTLTGNLTADDYFEAYISTNDSVQGTLIGHGLADAGTDHYGWNMLFPLLLTNLTAPPNSYFLHVKAWDRYHVIAGFKGDFNLSDTGFKFNNGTQALLTNTTNWKVSVFGFDGIYAATPTVVVPHPSWPSPIANQSWIWTNGGDFHDNTRYFTTEITSTVPEPGTILAAFSILAPAGILFRRRK